jgi:hypothetical protein
VKHVLVSAEVTSLSHCSSARAIDPAHGDPSRLALAEAKQERALSAIAENFSSGCFCNETCNGPGQVELPTDLCETRWCIEWERVRVSAKINLSEGTGVERASYMRG